MRLPFLLIVSIMLASCVPGLYSGYYEPSYPDQSSKLTKLYCGGYAGPPAKLTFLGPEGIKVAVVYKESAYKNEGLQLYIDMAIPSGADFQFLSDAIEISETKDGAMSIISSPEISIVTSVKLPFDAWVDFNLLGPTSVELAQKHSSYSKEGFTDVSFTFRELRDFPTRGKPELEMTLPPMQTAAHKVIAIPPIKLFSKVEMPVVFYPSDFFSIKHDDFSIRGSISWGAGSSPFKAQELHGLTRIKTREVEKWKFSEASVLFKNSDSGEIWRVPVETIDVVWSIRAPFVSPIRATVSGQNPQTSLSIRTGLGKNESDNTYFIELPPFLLNGVKHQLSPIKLERKSFGVGIDPFNC